MQSYRVKGNLFDVGRFFGYCDAKYDRRQVRTRFNGDGETFGAFIYTILPPDHMEKQMTNFFLEWERL